ncbi:MAG: hypothetical protein JNM69_30225 [Archangium sp.]|nr:hypothetical protein [Archangium sp.]
MKPIATRVGLIIDGDNRFLGRSVFDDWATRLSSPTEAMMAALGVEVNAENAEAFRLIALCGMSPDARVWPLKLTRLLSSWGDPVAGFFGAQLVTAGRVMGPGAAGGAAVMLSWFDTHLGATPTGPEVAEALAKWKREHPGPLLGFGVPFRAVDERRAAMLKLSHGRPVSKRRFWQLHLRLAEALPAVPPNVALCFAALLLDSGVPPEHCGLATSHLMSHVFLAHAIEGAKTDGAVNVWPEGAVEFHGTPARRMGDGRRAEVPAALVREAAR